jgi:hypothetical protein
LDHNLQQPTNQQAEAIANPLEKQHGNFLSGKAVHFDKSSPPTKPHPPLFYLSPLTQAANQPTEPGNKKTKRQYHPSTLPTT